MTTDGVVDVLTAAVEGSGSVSPQRSDLVAHVCAAVASAVKGRSEPLAPRRVQLREPCGVELERALAQRVRRVLACTVLSEFEVFRAEHVDPLGRIRAMADGVEARRQMDEFMGWLVAGGLVDLLEQQPVLRDVLANVFEQWKTVNRALLAHLDYDWTHIEECFADRPAERVVQRMALDLGDPHDGGRTVGAVWIDGIGGVVFKPRDLTPDLVWQAVVAWVNERAGESWLRAPAVLAVGDHGWVEHIAPEACSDLGELETFYRRTGRLLCLTHVLGLGDIHHENLVAAGSQPVVVDLETLLAPQGRARLSTGPQAARTRLARSVNRLGFLPRRQAIGDGWLDMSSLGSGTAPGELVATGVGASLVPRDARVRLPVGANVPVHDGRAVGADGYVESICDGFEEMRRLLCRHGDELFAVGGPLSLLAGASARVLLRPTRDYAAALAAASRPEMLRDPARWTELLSPPRLSWLDDETVAEAVSEAEAAALRCGDIPLFRMRVDAPVLSAPGSVAGRTVPGFELGIDGASRRLAELGSVTAGRHLRDIRWAFQGRRSVPADRPPLARTWPSFDAATDEALLAEATRIGRQIADTAVYGEDGSCAWIIPAPSFAAEPYGLTVTSDSLYGGRTGVGLFLATLASVSGDSSFASVARAALANVAGAVVGDGDDRAERSCGGFAGSGSIIYALTEAAVILGDEVLLASAHDAAATLDPLDVARRDTELDVIGGRAGLCLALAALHHRTRSAHIAAILDDVAVGLANAATGTPRRWVGASGVALTGFGHGAAGIAHGLLAAAEVTGRAELLEVAAEAIVYEAAEYDAAVANWRDLRPSGFERGMVAWCNGAAGIGLSRLPWLGRLSGLDHDVARALAAVRRHPPGAMQHLCCGDAGRIEMLHSTGVALGDPSLVELARRRASWLIERARDHGGRYVLEVGAAEGSEPNPTLMRGIAGIGYAYLRLLNPVRVPPVLMLRPAISEFAPAP